LAFFKSDDISYRTLYLSGGSVHGISQAQVLIFLEDLTGIPIAWQYDMLAGDSIGSTPASVLNMPIEPGSHIPKFSAREYNDLLIQVAQETFEPYREDYYNDMVKLELKIKACEAAIHSIETWSKRRDRKFAKAINTLIDKARDIGRTITGSVEDVPKEQSSSLTSTFNLHSGLTEKTVLPVIKRILERANKEVEGFFFSAEPIYDALDQHLIFADGSLATVSDTITGLHSEAFNINKREAEAHTVIKRVKNWDGHVSHQGLPLAEVPKRSMPAQTIFKPYYSPYSGQHYDDIASHNTMAASMNEVRRKFSRAIDEKKLQGTLKRHGVSIGTGIMPPDLNPERMGQLLLLGRLDSSEGAPLLNIPLLFNTSKAIRDLEEELGHEHAIFIDKIIDPKISLNRYKYKDQLKIYGSDYPPEVTEGCVETEAKRLPAMNMIDASDAKVSVLTDFGWAMVRDNLEELVHEAKEGLKYACAKKYISEEELQAKLEHIDSLFPQTKSDAKRSQQDRSFIDFLTFGARFPKFSSTNKDHNNSNDNNDINPDQGVPSPML